MRETLLIILLAVGFVGSVSVYFINGRSFVRSAGGICAVLIACVLSYLLFIPLKQGVSIYTLTPRIVALAFVPLAAVLLGQGVYHFISNRPVREAALAGEPERGSVQKPEAKKQFSFFAKNRMTGKERLAAMLSGIEEKEAKPVKDKPSKKDKKRTDKKEKGIEERAQVIREQIQEIKEQAQKAPDVKVLVGTAGDECEQEEARGEVITGKERLAAMLESVQKEAQTEQAATEDTETELNKGDMPSGEDTIGEAATEDTETEPNKGDTPSGEDTKEQAATDDAEIEPNDDDTPSGEDTIGEAATEDTETEPNEEDAQSGEDIKEQDDMPQEPELSLREKASIKLLDKAKEAKSCGGMKLASALFEEYLKAPISEETKTYAMRELLDCCIAQKQTSRAKELAQSLTTRLDEEGSQKMKLLLRLLK